MPARFVQKYQIERDVPIKRNVVMNADLAIWQRGTTFAGLSGTSDTYTADRWRFNPFNSGTWTVSRDPDVPSNNEAFSVTVTVNVGDLTINAGDFCQFFQPIEGYNYKSLYQKFQVLSFWVKSNVVGEYGASVRNQGPMPNRSYVMPFTIDVANVWERKELVVANPISTGGTWNFTNGVGAYLTIALVSGSTFKTGTPNQWITGNFIATSSQVNLASAVNNYISLAGVQFEEGQIATPFQFVGIEEELARCQRYYEKSYNVDTPPGTIGSPTVPLVGYTHVIRQNTTGQHGGAQVRSVDFKSTKRATPTVIRYSPVTGASGVGAHYNGNPITIGTYQGDTVNVVINTIQEGVVSFQLNPPVNPLVVGEFMLLHWTADAELV